MSQVSSSNEFPTLGIVNDEIDGHKEQVAIFSFSPMIIREEVKPSLTFDKTTDTVDPINEEPPITENICEVKRPVFSSINLTIPIELKQNDVLQFTYALVTPREPTSNIFGGSLIISKTFSTTTSTADPLLPSPFPITSVATSSDHFSHAVASSDHFSHAVASSFSGTSFNPTDTNTKSVTLTTTTSTFVSSASFATAAFGGVPTTASSVAFGGTVSTTVPFAGTTVNTSVQFFTPTPTTATSIFAGTTQSDTSPLFGTTPNTTAAQFGGVVTNSFPFPITPKTTSSSIFCESPSVVNSGSIIGGIQKPDRSVFTQAATSTEAISPFASRDVGSSLFRSPNTNQLASLGNTIRSSPTVIVGFGGQSSSTLSTGPIFGDGGSAVSHTSSPFQGRGTMAQNFDFDGTTTNVFNSSRQGNQRSGSSLSGFSSLRSAGQTSSSLFDGSAASNGSNYGNSTIGQACPTTFGSANQQNPPFGGGGGTSVISKHVSCRTAPLETAQATGFATISPGASFEQTGAAPNTSKIVASSASGTSSSSTATSVTVASTWGGFGSAPIITPTTSTFGSPTTLATSVFGCVPAITPSVAFRGTVSNTAPFARTTVNTSFQFGTSTAATAKSLFAGTTQSGTSPLFGTTPNTTATQFSGGATTSSPFAITPGTTSSSIFCGLPSIVSSGNIIVGIQKPGQSVYSQGATSTGAISPFTSRDVRSCLFSSPTTNQSASVGNIFRSSPTGTVGFGGQPSSAVNTGSIFGGGGAAISQSSSPFEGGKMAQNLDFDLNKSEATTNVFNTSPHGNQRSGGSLSGFSSFRSGAQTTSSLFGGSAVSSDSNYGNLTFGQVSPSTFGSAIHQNPPFGVGGGTSAFSKIVFCRTAPLETAQATGFGFISPEGSFAPGGGSLAQPSKLVASSASATSSGPTATLTTSVTLSSTWKGFGSAPIITPTTSTFVSPTTMTTSVFGGVPAITSSVAFGRTILTSAPFAGTTANTSVQFGTPNATTATSIFTGTTQSGISALFGTTPSTTTTEFGGGITNSSPFAIKPGTISSSIFCGSPSTVSSGSIFCGIQKPDHSVFTKTATSTGAISPFASSDVGSSLFRSPNTNQPASAGNIFRSSPTGTVGFGGQSSSTINTVSIFGGGGSAVSQSSSPFEGDTMAPNLDFDGNKSEATTNVFNSSCQGNQRSGGSLYGFSSFRSGGQATSSLFGGSTVSNDSNYGNLTIGQVFPSTFGLANQQNPPFGGGSLAHTLNAVTSSASGTSSRHTTKPVTLTSTWGAFGSTPIVIAPTSAFMSAFGGVPAITSSVVFGGTVSAIAPFAGTTANTSVQVGTPTATTATSIFAGTTQSGTSPLFGTTSNTTTTQFGGGDTTSSPSGIIEPSTEVKEEDSYDDKLKCVNQISKPMASTKLARKCYKLIKKATKQKTFLRYGLKDVQTRLRKGETGIVIFAGDVTLIDIMCHLPIVCEEKSIPYVYIPSRADLGAAMGVKWGTVVVLVRKHEDYTDLFDELKAEISSLPIPT